MAYFGPYRAKMAFAALTVWHYVYSGFSESLSIFKNPILVKSRRATKKQKNEDGRATRKKICHFLRTLVLGASHGHFKIGNLKTPFSPQLWACAHSTDNCEPQTHLKPEGGATDNSRMILRYAVKCFVKYGTVYAPDSHPTPSELSGILGPFFFWSVLRPRWRRCSVLLCLHAFNACITTDGGSEARHLTPPIGSSQLLFKSPRFFGAEDDVPWHSLQNVSQSRLSSPTLLRQP